MYIDLLLPPSSAQKALRDALAGVSEETLGLLRVGEFVEEVRL